MIQCTAASSQPQQAQQPQQAHQGPRSFSPLQGGPQFMRLPGLPHIYVPIEDTAVPIEEQTIDLTPEGVAPLDPLEERMLALETRMAILESMMPQ